MRQLNVMPRHGAVEVQLTGAPHCTKLYGYGIPVSLLLIAQRGDATSVGGKRGYHLRGVLSTSSAGGALDVAGQQDTKVCRIIFQSRPFLSHAPFSQLPIVSDG
jgi:hypothetical protein